jgi:hypothetical protein
LSKLGTSSAKIFRRKKILIGRHKVRSEKAFEVETFNNDIFGKSSARGKFSLVGKGL